MATDEAEEQRITAMKLLGELSFALGPDLVMRRVAPQVLHTHAHAHAHNHTYSHSHSVTLPSLESSTLETVRLEYCLDAYTISPRTAHSESQATTGCRLGALDHGDAQ